MIVFEGTGELRVCGEFGANETGLIASGLFSKLFGETGEGDFIPELFCEMYVGFPIFSTSALFYAGDNRVIVDLLP